jgi:hypothetical protein
MEIYIKLFYLFIIVTAIIFFRRKYVKLFTSEKQNFSFKDFKSYNLRKKIFVFSIPIFCLMMCYTAVFLFLTPKTNGIIVKTETYETVTDSNIKEKSIEDLERDSNSKKSEYYKMMHPDKFNSDSIREVEYKKTLEKFGN